MGEISFKENELYQEIELFVDGEKIGEAEVEIKGKMLSRLSIFPPYQDMAIVKKWAGNNGNYNNIFREFIPEMAQSEKEAKKAAKKAKKAQKSEE